MDKNHLPSTSINWYPGHMAKAIKEINEKVKIVDLVIVLLDARCPISSFNPLLKDSLNNKRKLYVLTKKDKADPKETEKFIEYYKKIGIRAISVDARELKSAKSIIKEAQLIMEEKRKKDAMRGIKPRPIKTMIVGIPNVGKSTLINALVGKRVTQVGDKPGVTKVQQWIKINQELELLDTPGVLWPKFDDQMMGINLAISGAISDNVMPLHDIGLYFVDFLQKYYKDAIKSRYNIDTIDKTPDEVLELLAKKENNVLASKEYDLDRTALFLLYEARNGYLGRITLDRCENYE